jgi:deoxyribonuclease-4
LRIGIHTSISKSLEGAALKAAELGANTFQIFSSSPRQWRPSQPGPAQAAMLHRARQKYDLTPLVIHDNYLINLAAADDLIRERSIVAFRSELERAILIEAEFVVAHPGNYRALSLEEGIMRFLDGMARAARGLKFDKLMLLAECTVGAGSQIGGRFEELHAIREFAAQMTHLPVGFCLDTCHLLASGYDVATEAGLKKTIAEADRILGLEHVHVIHANDSKTPLGSHIDRHEHIGQGYIGLDGFRRILTHPKLRSKAFILETPVDKEGDDRRNVETLKSLCRKPRTTTSKSS